MKVVISTMRKELEFERKIPIKFETIKKDVKMLREKINTIERRIERYSDVYPNKKELATMNQFLRDLKKRKTSAFTPLKDLKK